MSTTAASDSGGRTTRPGAADIAAPLLDVLRRDLGEPALSWARPPQLLGDGVTARAFSLHLAGTPGHSYGPLVCRVFCDGGKRLPPDQVAVEAALQNALAEAGFPAPRALAWGDGTGTLGTPFLVMEQVPGWNAFASMLVALAFSGGAALVGVYALLPLLLLGHWLFLARLLRRLHRVSGVEVVRALADVGVEPMRLGLDAALEALGERIERSELQGAARVLEWLRSNRPEPLEPPIVCHGDFWLGNLMLSARRVALLDWTQAGLGHRELDLGWMSIQHYSRMPLAVPDPLYDWLWLPVRPFTWLLMAPTRLVYRLGGGVDPGRVRYFAALCAVRILVHGESLRRGARPYRDRDQDRDPTPAELRAWGSQHTTALLRRRLRRITGVDLGP